MNQLLQQAHREAFARHERHRELTREARKALSSAREADTRVRQLESLERERSSRKRRAQ